MAGGRQWPTTSRRSLIWSARSQRCNISCGSRTTADATGGQGGAAASCVVERTQGGLGCPLRAYESEAINDQLRMAGDQRVADADLLDGFVVDELPR